MPIQQDNYHLVEGEWKSFRIRKIKPSDYEKVLEHVREYFVRDEPTCKLLGYEDQFAEEVSLVVESMFKDNISLLAETLDTKEIASVRVTYRANKNTTFDDVVNPENIHWKTDVFLNYVDLTSEQKYDVCRKHGVTDYAELFLISTNPKFRNQGLSTELYKRNIILLKIENFRLVKAIFTNPTTRRAGERLGFKEYYNIYYKNFRNSSGKPVMPSHILNDEHYAQVCFLPLTRD